MKINYLKSMIVAASLTALTAQAGVVLVGHATSSDSFNKSQAKKLYLGKLKKLGNGQSPKLLELPTGSALKTEFHSKVTGKNDAKLQSYWARLVFTGKGKAPSEVASAQLVKSEVANNPNAVGYIDEADVDATVKVLFKP